MYPYSKPGVIKTIGLARLNLNYFVFERDGDKNPGWIYEAAMVARDLGQEARMLDRLMFFVHQQTSKSPELEKALQALVLRGATPEAFRLYHAQYGAGAANAPLGLAMLRRIRAEGQAEVIV